MDTTKPTTRQKTQKLSREVKKIKFKNHYEIWRNEKNEPKLKTTKIPGKHADEQGVIKDQKNLVVVLASPDLTKKGREINTSLGMGKSYGTLPGVTKTVCVITNW